MEPRRGGPPISSKEGTRMDRAWAIPIVAVALTQIAVIAPAIYLHRV